MKAVLLLLTSFLIINNLVHGATLTLREGITLKGRIVKFDKDEFTFLKEDAKESETINNSQIQSICLAEESEVDDLFCFQQAGVIKELKESTILRSIKVINLKTPYLWETESVFTVYCHNEMPMSLVNYNLFFASNFEDIEILSAHFISTESLVAPIAEEFFSEGNLYPFFPNLSDITNLKVDVPQIPAKTICNIRIKGVRKAKDQFSNFHESFNLSSTLPVLRSEVRVNHAEEAGWKLNNMSNAADKIKYLRTAETGTVSKVWWMENILPKQDTAPTLSLSAKDLSKSEMVQICTKYVAEQMTRIDKEIVRTQQLQSVKQIINNFRRNFVVLPSIQVPFAEDPVEAFSTLSGNSVTLSIMVANELKRNGHDVSMILAKEQPEKPDVFFNFSSYNIPILKVEGDETDYFSICQTSESFDNTLIGFKVFGKGLMEDITITKAVKPIDFKQNMKLNLKIEESKVTLEGTIPLVSEIADKSAVEQPLRNLYKSEAMELMTELKGNKLIFKLTGSASVNQAENSNTLTLKMPKLNELFKFYPDFNTTVVMNVTIPEERRVLALPTETKSHYRRFSPTTNGFKVKVSTNMVYKEENELIVLSRRDAKENRFWFE